jgi:hypothetical protein
MHSYNPAHPQHSTAQHSTSGMQNVSRCLQVTNAQPCGTNCNASKMRRHTQQVCHGLLQLRVRKAQDFSQTMHTTCCFEILL